MHDNSPTQASSIQEGILVREATQVQLAKVVTRSDVTQQIIGVSMLRAPLSFATTIIIGALYHVPQDKTILAISNNNWRSTNKSYQLYPRLLLRRTSINKSKGAYVITCQHSLFVFSKKETNGFVFHLLAALCGARGCFWDSCLVSAQRRKTRSASQIVVR